MTYLEQYQAHLNGDNLHVGDRVRINGFGECPFYNHETWDRQAFNHTWCHQERLVGREGVITRTDFPGARGHRFEVRFVNRRGRRGGVGHYLAYELEKVSQGEIALVGVADGSHHV